ncbi:MAG: hypothetical protein MK078_02125 [Crocinitomicaceae bacterium]|nr:hypothetical protein [Crocinitomicaceae bacterium]
MRFLFLILSFFNLFSAYAYAMQLGSNTINVVESSFVSFKIKLDAYVLKEQNQLDSIRDATHVNVFRIDQFGNEVECEIVEGSITIVGAARIGKIQGGGKLSNPARFILINSAGRSGMIYLRFIYKSDTLTKTHYFSVLR